MELVRPALVSALVTALAGAAPARTFDECLKNLRSGPDSFVEYLCLGTPGLPEHAPEVRAALHDVLKRTPGEPHARLYLALMRLYQYEDVDKREFAEPLATFERNPVWPDVFLAQMAFIERECIRLPRVPADCTELGPLLDRADRLARSIDDAGLVRLAAIARMRWSLQILSFSEARRAERDLDAIPGPPPEWLKVLEVSTRARLASLLGDEFRVRQLFSGLLATTPPDSVSHSAALAGLAGATTRMAWQGLADRGEAEHLLRTALAAQQRLEIVGYNGMEIGTGLTRLLLGSLLGRTPETLAGIAENDQNPSSFELLLQGPEVEQMRALRLARGLTAQTGTTIATISLARAHVELAVGDPSEGMRWGDRAIDILEKRRGREGNDEIRMKGDSTYAIVYQTYASDLVDSRPSNRQHLERAWRVMEQLRARVLLETLLARNEGARARTETIPDVAELQSVLDQGEALVSFLVWAPRPTVSAPYARGHSFALVLTKNDLRAVPIAQGETLEPAVKSWTRLVEGRRGNAEPGGRRLYADVLRPVLDVLPANVTSLTLVPDGPLHRLPFDALSATGGPPFVADHYAISIVPSASVWLQLRTRPATTPGLAVAFASTDEGQAVGVAEKRGEVEPGRLAALLHAREEAEEAVEAFPRGSRLFAGAGATPDQLTSTELERASLVHFAAHGVANARDPDESFLLLAPGSGGSGKLKVADVQRFNWTGKTVVLSACETSVGAFRIGEGILSLARGFFAGGASSVIGTLSEVRDDDQRRLFHAFYAELRRGTSVGEAMVAAKRSLIRSGAPPAAWANVVVLGDATVHPRAPDPPRPRWPLPVATVLGALLVIAVGLRRKRWRPADGSAISA